MNYDENGGGAVDAWKKFLVNPPKEGSKDFYEDTIILTQKGKPAYRFGKKMISHKDPEKCKYQFLRLDGEYLAVYSPEYIKSAGYIPTGNLTDAHYEEMI